MKLKKIIQNLDIVSIQNFKDYNIKSISHISKDIIPSSIFICIKGNNYNGNNYIGDAIKNGAKCIITEDKNLVITSVCVIVVKDCRIAMSIVAKNFYNSCCDDLKIIGIIGTSGKTTTTIMISQLLKYNKMKIGVIGTNGIFIDNIKLDNKFTTPDPLELHYVFYQMKMLGVEIVIMEVSAQAIYYNKLYGVFFELCVFTNISREHLDFFGSMENYARTKMNFFSKKNMKECIVNIDDFYGRELAYKVDIPCVSYGLNEPSNSFAIDIYYDFDTTKFVANIIDDIIDICVPFVGIYNVYNLIASLTVVKMLGMRIDEIKLAVNNMSVIDGRYNVYNINDKTIIIDFAHTPSSINSLLKHISDTSDFDIVSVFGCVGYSNKDKRQEMALVIDKFSSKIVVTSDNPGNTKFDDICKDIVEVFSKENYTCIEDRECAIKYAYDNLQENEVLVLIGKGAEDFQTIGNERVKYSDKESILKLIKE